VVSGGFELAAAVEAAVRSQPGPRALLYEPFALADAMGLPLALRARGVDLVRVADAGERVSDFKVALTGASFGIAETGSLVVGGQPGGWGLATVLPWIHVAVLDIADLAEDLTTVFGKFVDRFDAGERDWVWITGPSKTADIAKTLVNGIHGPNELRVLLVDRQAGVAR
jgi:L-lactate dehydrogenase complex protein LldG